jgi:hypothetical protein
MKIATHELTGTHVDQAEKPPVATTYPQEMGRFAVGEHSTSDLAYKFIFCTHSPENSSAIAEELKDCDIVAIETVGLKPEERTQLEETYTQEISSSATEPSEEKFFSTGGRFLDGIVAELKQSDKKVVLIDIDEDSSEYQLTQTAYGQFDHSLRFRNIPSNQLKKLLVDAIQAYSEASRTRESVVAKQLADLQNDHKAKKVGVVVGSVHTAPQHMLERSGSSTERVFVDTNGGGAEKAHFSYDDQALRQLSLKPDVPLKPSLIDRVLLEKMYSLYTENTFSDSYEHFKEMDRIHVEVLESMSDKEVDEALQKIDEIKMANDDFDPSGMYYRIAGFLKENQQTVIDRQL